MSDFINRCEALALAATAAFEGKARRWAISAQSLSSSSSAGQSHAAPTLCKPPSSQIQSTAGRA